MLNINKLKRQRIILFSPVAIVVLGSITAHLSLKFFNTWAWLPTNLILWGMFGFMIYWGAGRKDIKGWLQPSRGAWGWSVLALTVGIIPLGVFILNWNLFPATWIVIAWVLFALINPLLEEGYWRGLLIDNTGNWPIWLRLLYSTFFFAINHPLSLGAFSIANRHPVTFVSTFIMGLVWSYVYYRTKSLRWVIVAHILTDLLNLSILTFLNIVVP